MFYITHHTLHFEKFVNKHGCQIIVCGHFENVVFVHFCYCLVDNIQMYCCPYYGLSSCGSNCWQKWKYRKFGLPQKVCFQGKNLLQISQSLVFCFCMTLQTHTLNKRYVKPQQVDKSENKRTFMKSWFPTPNPLQLVDISLILVSYGSVPSNTFN
jgi:hypothetical protein